MAGILKHIREITLFMNPCVNSYMRLGERKAPKYITWSPENRSQLIRVPAATGKYRRIELRSPDPMANPYIAFALLIHAGLDGINNNLKAGEPVNIDLFTADKSITSKLEQLPASLAEAVELAKNSAFVNAILPREFVELYL